MPYQPLALVTGCFHNFGLYSLGLLEYESIVNLPNLSNSQICHEMLHVSCRLWIPVIGRYSCRKAEQKVLKTYKRIKKISVYLIFNILLFCIKKRIETFAKIICGKIVQFNWLSICSLVCYFLSLNSDFKMKRLSVNKVSLTWW